MRDTHPRPLGWGSLQMLPCFNAAQQGMTHPSVPPHPLPWPTRNGCPYFTSAVDLVWDSECETPNSELLLFFLSGSRRSMCWECKNKSDGVVALHVHLQGGLAAVVFQCFLWQSPPLPSPGWKRHRPKLGVVVTKL